MLISTATTVSVPPQEVFALLADLDRHRTLTDHRMRILQLDGPYGRRSGGVVELCAPMGIRRRARTRVDGVEFPSRLWGAAETTAGSRATVCWQLSRVEAGTRVRLDVELVPTYRDRLLLALGGRWWLWQRLRLSLRQLSRNLLAGVG